MMKTLACATGAALAALLLTGRAFAGGIFLDAYSQSTSFTDAQSAVSNFTPMGIAFDGADYWAVAGGTFSDFNYVRYGAAGTSLGTYKPGLDFRSVFTDAAGHVFARENQDPLIYQQTSPGVFASSVTLQGTVDNEAAVVLDRSASQYVQQAGGVVSRWGTDGKALPSVSLVGFGTPAGEGANLSGRVAAAGGYWLTYDPGLQTLSAWDHAGQRVGTTVLTGAATQARSEDSLSFANNLIWIDDGPGGQWRGYDVGLSDAVPVPLPSGAAACAVLFGLLGARNLRSPRGAGEGRRGA